jgi:hypothetical protein
VAPPEKQNDPARGADTLRQARENAAATEFGPDNSHPSNEPPSRRIRFDHPSDVGPVGQTPPGAPNPKSAPPKRVDPLYGDTAEL